MHTFPDAHKSVACCFQADSNRQGFEAETPDPAPCKPYGGWKVAVVALCVVFGGCERQAASVSGSPSQETAKTEGAGGGTRAKQADFLNRIREADPDFRTIEKALLNEQNELGLVLNRSVELEKIPSLMRVMLTRMAAEFPGENLTVVAYAPSNPPRKVGTAHLNARTRDMTYTPE